MCPPFESFLGFCNFESCWVHSRVQDDLDCTQISNVRTFIKETIKENNESILLFTTLTTSRKTWFHSKITSPCKRVANLNIFTLSCDVFSINFKPRFRYSDHLLWWFRFLLLTLNEDMKIKFRTGNGFFLFSTVITQESTPVFLCYLKISFSQYYHWNFYGLVNFELDTFNFVAIVHGKKLSSLLSMCCNCNACSTWKFRTCVKWQTTKEVQFVCKNWPHSLLTFMSIIRSLFIVNLL